MSRIPLILALFLMSLNQGSYNSSCTTLRIWLKLHKPGAFWLGESNIYSGYIGWAEAGKA